MAREILTRSIVGDTLYAVVMNTAGQLWNTSGPAFENINASHWSNYAIGLADQAGTGIYWTNFPGTITSGTYEVLLYTQLGSSPALGDGAFGSISVNWNGTAQIPPNVNVAAWDGTLAAVQISGGLPLVTGSGSGSGAYDVTVNVTDATTGDPIMGAFVKMKTGGTPYTNTTDIDGNATFSLDAATYTLTITAIGYTFTPVSEPVSGDATIDVEMTELLNSAVYSLSQFQVAGSLPTANMFDIQPEFTVVQGATCKLAMQMRIAGTQTGWDVSTATSITVLWRTWGSSTTNQITANSADPAASWSTGLVVFTVTPTDVTQNVGTVAFVLQVVLPDGQTILSPAGTIEVQDWAAGLSPG